MKLRIRGNSLRLRLGRSEVAKVGEGRRVEDAVAFGPGSERLVYAIVPSGDAQEIHARFIAKEIVVTVPERAARDWALGDAVGLESTQCVGDGEALAVLVEKDFACLKPRDGEDDADAFANPTNLG